MVPAHPLGHSQIRTLSSLVRNRGICAGYRPADLRWLHLSATLVEGPSDAILQGSMPGGPAFSYSCAIARSQANCQLVASDQTTTETTSIVELVSPFLVQGGGSSGLSLSSGLPSSMLTSIPLTSSPLSTTHTTATSRSNLPQQPTATSLNSAHGRHYHMSWAWLGLGLFHVFYNI